MNIDSVMAQLIVTDLEPSVAYYTKLFGRGPDARPMDRLAEWHFDDAGAIQVFEEAERAGRSGATMHLTDLDRHIADLDRAGVEHEPLVEANYLRVVTLADPDANRIVFTGDK